MIFGVAIENVVNNEGYSGNFEIMNQKIILNGSQLAKMKKSMSLA